MKVLQDHTRPSRSSARLVRALLALAFLAPLAARSQDSTQTLDPIVVNARTHVPPPVIGRLPDVRGTEIFAGKKTETIQVDSLHMNTAQDVSRQLFSRVPGANITETANSGFPSNGIGFRGLNPVQS